MSDPPLLAPDPRTRQFFEVLAAIVIVAGVHAASFFLAVESDHLFSSGYAMWVFVVLPAFAIIIAATLTASRRWHWGQALLLIVAATVATFIQAAIIGGASASV